MKTALKNNGLSLFFGFIFLLAVVGQGISGHALFNEEQLSAGLEEISLAQYLTSSDFAVDVSENWQSEYLQFLLYILATIWLVQKGSPESKELDQAGLESDKDQLVGEYSNDKSPAWARVSGWRRTLFANSLGLTMGLIFILSWLVQSISGNNAYNEEQLRNFQDPAPWTEYVVSPEFWNRTLQNWQSEFLAVGSMVVLAIYLRQHSSPESKPVGAAHDDTAATG
ncbi:hypothetical protein F8G81_18405 [Arthrobacter sp. CDRTa11]|uniref:DUF6766 family protein n=1 Tax=Arthrobacter sp. CDRTa11 TaxID=2651199 RepID=UPI002265AC86|nr:DUF6766 family protein [Arthrobacter sp. CDRTa11]UZX04363.1 hypothetical protein F8G81_18405 [Arthrobacter sp. CDRTa11]